MVRILYTMYANRSVWYCNVPKILPIRWVLKDRFEMALYRTVPIRTVPYHIVHVFKMHVYRTVPVPYRIEIKTNKLSSRGSWRNSYIPYATVPYRTAPPAVCRMCGRVVRYGTVQYGTVPYQLLAGIYLPHCIAGPYYWGSNRSRWNMLKG